MQRPDNIQKVLRIYWESLTYIASRILIGFLIFAITFYAIEQSIVTLAKNVGKIQNNVVYQLARENRAPDFKGVKNFFADKKKNIPAFAQYIYDNSGRLPKSEPGRSQWIQQAVSQHLFSKQELKDRVKGIAQSYQTYIRAYTNRFAIVLDKEYGFKAASLPGFKQNPKINYDTMAQMTIGENRQYWVADVGGNIAIELTAGAIISDVTSKIGEGLFGENGKLIGWLGGVALTYVIGSYYSEYQKKKSIRRVTEQTYAWMDNLEKKLHKEVMDKLINAFKLEIGKLQQVVLDRRIESYIGFSAFRRYFYIYQHEQNPWKQDQRRK